ncbi:MAG TPA: hypothetical protein VKU89_01400 [Solirubrobacteraceae bacterium]|nr:hypothetical protein [Solirubrobacteraceae bacterium]
MRFVEFLRATVVLTAAAASALGVLAVLVAAPTGRSTLLLATLGWWVLAVALGLWLGRRQQASPAIARLLARAKASPALPSEQPGTILLNRLWPLLAVTILAGALALVAPQVPGIGAGFAIAGALAWRRQHAAVAAIEKRDGVCFYVLRTSPLQPIALQRTPGFKSPAPDARGRALP